MPETRPGQGKDEPNSNSIGIDGFDVLFCTANDNRDTRTDAPYLQIGNPHSGLLIGDSCSLALVAQISLHDIFRSTRLEYHALVEPHSGIAILFD